MVGLKLAASLLLLLWLTGCEDKETVIARCKIEAYKTVGGSATLLTQADYVKSCMKVTGYIYLSGCEMSIPKDAPNLLPYCFYATGLIAQGAESLFGKK
jgi:hypothetical protein